jgi:hypothetical protein
MENTEEEWEDMRVGRSKITFAMDTAEERGRGHDVKCILVSPIFC